MSPPPKSLPLRLVVVFVLVGRWLEGRDILRRRRTLVASLIRPGSDPVVVVVATSSSTYPGGHKHPAKSVVISTA